jgi:hypothetical protein
MFATNGGWEVERLAGTAPAPSSHQHPHHHHHHHHHHQAQVLGEQAHQEGPTRKRRRVKPATEERQEQDEQEQQEQKEKATGRDTPPPLPACTVPPAPTRAALDRKVPTGAKGWLRWLDSYEHVSGWLAATRLPELEELLEVRGTDRYTAVPLLHVHR